MIDSVSNHHKLFLYYKSLGDKAMAQIRDDSLFFWTPGPESNCIAVIVQHLHGNMKSRWTDFLTSDGEKEWRNRDREFELYCETRDEMMRLWEEGWQCLFDALVSVPEDKEDTIVYIRNQGHMITEAAERQLGHYAYHVGQIVFMARMLTKADWESLSIPKNASAAFNEKTFGNGKRKEHFTKNL